MSQWLLTEGELDAAKATFRRLGVAAWTPRFDLETNDDDCPPCQRGEHRACLDVEGEDYYCECAAGGHA